MGLFESVNFAKEAGGEPRNIAPANCESTTTEASRAWAPNAPVVLPTPLSIVPFAARDACDGAHDEIQPNPEFITCSLSQTLGSPAVPTPNNPITAATIQALTWSGKPLQETEGGWQHGPCGWEFAVENPKSKIVVTSDDPDFEEIFGNTRGVEDIAVLGLVAAATAYQLREPAYISERSIYAALGFSSYGEKRRNLHDQIHRAIHVINSLRLNYEGLPSGNKRKSLGASDDFLLKLTPVRTTTPVTPYATTWKVELGHWGQTYLSARRFTWIGSLPRQVFTLATHIGAERMAKGIAYCLLGFPGGTHHLKKGVTARKIQKLLLAVGGFPRTNSMKGVKNWKYHIREDMERAFVTLCQRGLMESVIYDPLPDTSRYWFPRWLQANVIFSLNLQHAEHSARDIS